MYQMSLEKIENALKTYEVQNEFVLYKNMIDNMDIKSVICPNCLITGGCIKHTGYQRYLVTIENNEVMIYYLKIPRGRCKCCSRTFSILPDRMKCFSSYSESFVLNVVRDYVMHRYRNVGLLCEHYQIAVSTLYEWLAKIELNI